MTIAIPVKQAGGLQQSQDAGPDAPRKVARSAAGQGRPEADRSSQDAGPDAPRRYLI
jgi:hypothetical protein